MKTAILAVLIVLGMVIYSLFSYGEFGYDLSRTMTAYTEIDGEMVFGQKGYEHNKKVATSYKGEVTEDFLQKMHEDYNASSYAVVNDSKFYNGTYRFFQDIFAIEHEHYFGKEDVWSEVDGSVIYGFTGDWDSYGNILGDIFKAFSFFIIIFAAPLFTNERECGMLETVGTVRYGGEQLLKYKMKAVFIVLNIFLFAMLAFVSILHFSQYGFANADVSVQCSAEKSFVNAVLSCNMGQLTIFKLLFGVLGCNMILMSVVLISMLSMSSLASLCTALVATWALNYRIVHALFNHRILDMILALLPVNALDIESLIKAVPNKVVLCVILVVQTAVFIGLSVITKKLWNKRTFYTKK